MDTIGIWLFFIVPMVATIPVAAFICRYRVARKRGVSYGTMLTAASCIPCLLAAIATCFDPEMWW
jgi:Ca2+/H+ antiporter